MDKIFKNQCCRPQVTNKGQRKTTQLITHVYHMYICMHYSSTTTITTNGGMSLYLFNQPSVQSYSRLGWLTTRKPMRITGALNNTQKYWSNHGRTTQWTSTFHDPPTHPERRNTTEEPHTEPQPFMIHQPTSERRETTEEPHIEPQPFMIHQLTLKEGTPRKNHTLNLNLSWSTNPLLKERTSHSLHRLSDASILTLGAQTTANTFVKMSVCVDRHIHLFNGLFSRTAWVSQYQKGYTNLDFNEARDDWVALTSAGPCANHLHLTPGK